MTSKRHPLLWFVLCIGLISLLPVTACGAPDTKTAESSRDPKAAAKPGEPPATEKDPAGTEASAVKVFVDTSALKPAPNFKVPDLTGKVRSLDEFRGKVVLLDFWATWCGPCRQEIPHFIKLYDEYKSQGFEIVGVSLDAGGKRDVEPFAKAKGINYHMLLGNNNVAGLYGGVYGIPTAFVLTQDGKIYRKYVGFREKAVFESDIRALLGLGPKTDKASG